MSIVSTAFSSPVLVLVPVDPDKGGKKKLFQGVWDKNGNPVPDASVDVAEAAGAAGAAGEDIPYRFVKASRSKESKVLERLALSFTKGERLESPMTPNARLFPEPEPEVTGKGMDSDTRV
jgi:hypothetical protein